MVETHTAMCAGQTMSSGRLYSRLVQKLLYVSRQSSVYKSRAGVQGSCSPSLAAGLPGVCTVIRQATFHSMGNKSGTHP